MSANAKINSVLSYRQGSWTYFSLKVCCSCCSAAVKNSSISSELGMKRQTEASILRREVIELLDLLLVVDPGVLIISEFLIKLQGVVSLVLLQPKETWVKKLESFFKQKKSRKKNKECLKCTSTIAMQYIFFSLLNWKSYGAAQKQTLRKAIKTHYSKTLVLHVTVQSCTSALQYANVLTGKQKLILDYVSVTLSLIPKPRAPKHETWHLQGASWIGERHDNKWQIIEHIISFLICSCLFPAYAPTMWYLIYAAASTLNTGKQQVGLIETTELNRIFNKHMPTWAQAHNIMRLK